MESNIKSKNIKFNIDNDDDKLIIDYFDEHKDNFSKLTKKFMLEYVTKAKTSKSKSIMDVLEEHTRLLEKIVEKSVLIPQDQLVQANNLSQIESNQEFETEETEDKISEENNNKDDGFNMDFLNQ
jgi:L-lactate utilization protein LutC